MKKGTHLMKPTGEVYGRWSEYSETPIGHTIGYFWLRDDGLRAGLREAGEYYRPGTQPEPPVRSATIESGPVRWRIEEMAFDVVGAMREKAKREYLPTHVRVMRDGVEIEWIDRIDGRRVETRPVEEALDYLDKRYPPPARRNIRSVSTQDPQSASSSD